MTEYLVKLWDRGDGLCCLAHKTSAAAAAHWRSGRDLRWTLTVVRDGRIVKRERFATFRRALRESNRHWRTDFAVHRA